LGKYADARRSMQAILTFARRFRMDNPLTDFGHDVYQPKQPINITYDAFGVPAAFIRGLFEYLYGADELKLLPHIPAEVAALEQLDPIRFGDKQLFLSTVGHGPVTSVAVNGRPWPLFDAESVTLAYNQTPAVAHIRIRLGGSATSANAPTGPPSAEKPKPVSNDMTAPSVLPSLNPMADKARAFRARLLSAGLGDSYEAAHAQLILDAVRVARERQALLAAGRLPHLPDDSRAAAEKSYLDTVTRLSDGLAALMKSYEKSSDERERRLYKIYVQ